MLISNLEMQNNLIKSQTGASEKSLLTDIEMLMKQHSSALVSQIQTPYESSKMIASELSQVSGKKMEIVSPSENKYPKRKRPFEFGKKPNLEIDVNTANEDNNENG